MAFITVLIVLSPMGNSGGLVKSVVHGQTVMGIRDETLWEKTLGESLDSSNKTLSGDKRELAGSWALAGNRGNATGRAACK